jgi:hypothetical protein
MILSKTFPIARVPRKVLHQDFQTSLLPQPRNRVSSSTNLCRQLYRNRTHPTNFFFQNFRKAYIRLINRSCSLDVLDEHPLHGFTSTLSKETVGLLFSGLCRGRLDCWVADVSIAMLLFSSELSSKLVMSIPCWIIYITTF